MDINVVELKQRLDAGENFIFIDVREPHEFEEFNIGARLIPLGTVVDRITEFDDQKSEEIIIHCRSGKRSGMAQMLFQQAGFTNVRNVEGGILDWIDKFGK
ncbi:MAG: rhodanese-like domain-containing protein [Saprospiraceae bacterium]